MILKVVFGEFTEKTISSVTFNIAVDPTEVDDDGEVKDANVWVVIVKTPVSGFTPDPNEILVGLVDGEEAVGFQSAKVDDGDTVSMTFTGLEEDTSYTLYGVGLESELSYLYAVFADDYVTASTQVMTEDDTTETTDFGYHAMLTLTALALV